jgi:hypothetical protein
MVPSAIFAMSIRRTGSPWGLREPVGQVLRTVDAKREILLGVDLVEPIDRRRQQGCGGRRILEGERDIGLAMQPGARADLAVAEFDPASGPLVAP